MGDRTAIESFQTHYQCSDFDENGEKSPLRGMVIWVHTEIICRFLDFIYAIGLPNGGSITMYQHFILSSEYYVVYTTKILGRKIIAIKNTRKSNQSSVELSSLSSAYGRL